jgi:hypothetical protein
MFNDCNFLAHQLAANLIAECHPEQLVPDSRYLASSALTELINNIIQCSLALAPVPTSHPLPNQHEHGHAHQHHHHQQQESQGSQSQGFCGNLFFHFHQFVF